MPADARVAPWPGERGSMTLTLAPLFASSQATVQPTIPAPTTTTDGFTLGKYQNPTEKPTSMRRGGCADVGVPKNGDSWLPMNAL